MDFNPQNFKKVFPRYYFSLNTLSLLIALHFTVFACTNAVAVPDSSGGSSGSSSGSVTSAYTGATKIHLGPKESGVEPGDVTRISKSGNRKYCSSEDNCAANEDCVKGVCTTHCENQYDCDKWETCEHNLCYFDANLCPDPGENWDGEKCRHFTDSTTAVIILSIVAGLLLIGILIGVYFLAKHGYLPIPGFSRRSSKPIRRTKRVKPDPNLDDEDEDDMKKEKNGKNGHDNNGRVIPTLATIDE